MKLFRNLRIKWLAQGRVRRYLVYAVGEILLVVVGILIALWINNWNNERIEQRVARRIYENIDRKLGDDRAAVANAQRYNDRLLAQFGYAGELVAAADRDHLDTLAAITTRIFQYADVSRSSSLYQNLVSSGELKLLDNDFITDGLQRLEESYIYMNRLEENHFQLILRFVGPGVTENVNLATGDVARPDELYSFAFQNLLVGLTNIMQEKAAAYERVLTEIDVIRAALAVEK